MTSILDENHENRQLSLNQIPQILVLLELGGDGEKPHDVKL